MVNKPPDSTARKDALRKQLRQRRKALSPDARHTAATAAAQFITQLPNWQHAQRIALYLAADAELDPAPIATAAWRANKLLFLPVINDAEQLKFHPWETNSPMATNRFGIPEPTGASAIELGDLDIICLPLVGWNERGARLGMGGGYYDRALEGVSGPTLVGLAHECQRAENIPLEPWDITLKFVATGSRLYECQDDRHI